MLRTNVIPMIKEFWNDEQGIEGLPLKYIILVLVAALVVAILVQITGTIETGVTEATGELSEGTTDIIKRSVAAANKTI